MKKLLIIAVTIALAVACASHKKSAKTITPTLSQDSTEYELIIFDTHFESWFALNSSEAMKKSNAYYKHKNYLYVTDWNQKYRSGHPFFESYIDYRSNVEYGLDFNHKLYLYFQYVEKELGIRIRQGN